MPANYDFLRSEGLVGSIKSTTQLIRAMIYFSAFDVKPSGVLAPSAQMLDDTISRAEQVLAVPLFVDAPHQPQFALEYRAQRVINAGRVRIQKCALPCHAHLLAPVDRLRSLRWMK